MRGVFAEKNAYVALFVFVIEFRYAMYEHTVLFPLGYHYTTTNPQHPLLLRPYSFVSKSFPGSLECV